MSLEKVPKAAWIGGGLLVLAIVAVVVILVAGSSSSSGDGVSFVGDGYPGIDKASTRNVTPTPIDSSSVTGLEEAWSIPASAESSYGAWSTSPVVANGVVYVQDLESNVEAISLETGEVLWTKTYEQPDQGPNGVSVAEGPWSGCS